MNPYFPNSQKLELEYFTYLWSQKATVIRNGTSKQKRKLVRCNDLTEWSLAQLKWSFASVFCSYCTADNLVKEEMQYILVWKGCKRKVLDLVAILCIAPGKKVSKQEKCWNRREESAERRGATTCPGLIVICSTLQQLHAQCIWNSLVLVHILF